jgi:demethylmenaquinone methyltransferase/2-methoxy-6-polyprenyl-1,4-benzoquinol methylase
MSDELTDFGYEQVTRGEKAERVAAVFDSVAEKYDLMNDLMSFGVHRLWKRFAISLCAVREGHNVLDLAGGTGDLAIAFAHKVGTSGHVVLADINSPMLEEGRHRVIDAGVMDRVSFVRADAEKLPFARDSFDRVSIAFGLRNVTDKSRALRSMFDALRPGGSLSILEFSRVHAGALKTAYDFYSFKALPALGRFVANDADSYRYLAESIRMHPDQATLKTMMEQAGFERCDYHNLSGGVVALHRGYKL